MSETTTTKRASDYGEPWSREPDGYSIRNRDGDLVSQDARCTGEAKRDRLITCVNACAGMADPSAEIQAMRDAINTIYAEADAYADGAPDASAHDKFCNEIAAKLKPFIKP